MSTCNWWTACAEDVFNSQQGRCEMQTKQDLVPTNVNMYRVARKRRKPKNSSNKQTTLFRETISLMPKINN
jgi:hypothetical protein